MYIFHLLVSHFTLDIEAARVEHNVPLDHEDEWDAYFLARQPVNIAHVCRSWRATALASRALWSSWTIQIPFHPWLPSQRPRRELLRKRVSHLVRRALDWSGDGLLSFSLSIVDRDYAEEFRDVFFALEGQQHRWKKVEVVRYGSQRSPLLQLHPYRLYALEDLHLNCRSIFELDIAPPMSSRVPFPNIRSICLGKGYSREPWGDLKIIELTQSRLESLVLHLESPFNLQAHGQSGPLTFDNLRHLELNSFRLRTGGRNDPPPIVWRCPSLMHIRMENLLHVNLCSATTLIRESKSNITSSHLGIENTDAFRLIMAGSDGDQPAPSPSSSLMQFFSATPLTTFLCLHIPFAPHDTSFSQLLLALKHRNGQSFTVLPHLQNLEIWGVDMSHGAECADLIKSRWCAPNRTIRRIELCGSSYVPKRFRSSITNDLLPFYPPGKSCPVADVWKDVDLYVQEGLEFKSSAYSERY